jgi:trimeric autotransporter adhesin
MSPLIQLKKAAPVLLVAVVCFGLLPTLRAVNPPPDGGYGGQNTAEGTNALHDLTSGVWNTAVGFDALFNNTNGNQNTATGYRALFKNVTGDKSTAYGTQALYNNTTGNDNVATGFSTLYSNTTGNRNTGVGYRTLTFNNGDDNTAIGWNALYNNTGTQNTATGTQNTATGSQALIRNTTGSFNTANGVFALSNNMIGIGNTANGINALFRNTTGSFNTALGVGAGSDVTTASGVICIGHSGQNVSESCYIGKIFGAISSGGTAVFINSDGKLGTVASSRRFKEEIKPMDKASEALLALKPVIFRYKKGIDPQGVPQFGLVAEDVEAVNPDLVVRDKEGKVNTVRYDAVNAMLLNEFLKARRQIDAQQKQIEALTAGLQKVSAQLETSKLTPQVVANDQ